MKAMRNVAREGREGREERRGECGVFWKNLWMK